MSDALTKRCSVCLKTKAASEFYPQRKRSGYMNYCKVCSRKKAKAWRTKNHKHVHAARRSYKEQNRQRVREWQRKYWRKIKADPKLHDEFLAKHRAHYKEIRKYLPAKRRSKREREGYVDGRSLH